MPKMCLLALMCLSLIAGENDSQEKAKKIIDANNLNFTNGVLSKNAALMASNYAPDATLYPPNSQKIVGIAAIQAYWQGFIDFGATKMILKIEKADLDGSIAYEQGTADVAFMDKEGKLIEDSVKYVVVWRKQPDGSFKIVADIWNEIK